MGRRNEVRVSKRAPVLVHGTDPSGSPFAIPAQVLDISGRGASLTGLNGVGLPGTMVELEFQGRRARYRIQWVGKEGSKRANQVGLRCLEPGSFIWGVQLPDRTEDTFDLPQVEDAKAQAVGPRPGNGTAAKGKECRGFLRHTCRIEALVAIEGTGMSSSAIVSDVSLGGCYLETLSPFPMNTLIELTMHPSNTALRVHGQVRTRQDGMGMGISFSGLTPEDIEKLRKLALPEGTAPKPTIAAPPPQPAVAVFPRQPAATSSPAPVPDLASEFELQQDLTHSACAGAHQSVVAGQPSTADALEAIVRALFRKGILSRSEVAEELRKLQTVKS
jgi:hypothetical protein